MSDLYRVSELLEELNGSFGNLQESNDAVARNVLELARQMGEGRESSDQRGRDTAGMFFSPIKTAVITGFRRLADAVKVLEDLETRSLTTGLDQSKLLTDLKESQKAIEAGNKDADKMLTTNFAGLEKATMSVVAGGQVGLDLTQKSIENGLESNLVLRNQLALLEEQGGQGKAALGYFQDLIRRGYSPQQARMSMEKFTDIATFSMQSAESAKKVADQLRQTEAVRAVLGGAGGRQTAENLMQIAPDVGDRQAIGKFMAGVIMPTSEEQIMVAAALGNERTNFLKEFEAATDPQQAQRMFQDFASLYQETAVAFTGLEGAFEGPDGFIPGIAMAGSKTINELMQLATQIQEIEGMITQQTEIDEIFNDRKRTMSDVLDFLGGTFRFAEQQMNDTAFNSSRNLQVFRMVTADIAEAGTVAVERILSNIPSEVTGDREEINFFTDNTTRLLDLISEKSEPIMELFEALGEASDPVINLFKNLSEAGTPGTIPEGDAAAERMGTGAGAGEGQVPLGE
jgi:hypothetical protein